MNQPTHPSTQVLPTITEGPEHPGFGNILEVQLHELTNNLSTTTGSSQNGGGTSSTQTNGGGLHQSPPRAPSPAQVIQGDAELDQVQVQDWDEEAYEDEVVEEEEEFIRVQQEIKRLCQEQESIMRRQAAAQWAKLEGSISIESEQGLEGYSTTLTSFASRNKGKSLRSINCSIIPMPTLHRHKNTTFPMPPPPPPPP
jgi:hypothetical protein